MDRIYERHDDVGTCGVILYYNESADGSLIYKNKECTDPCTAEEARNAFFKGCVACHMAEDDVLKTNYKPVTMFEFDKAVYLCFADSGYYTQVGSNGEVKLQSSGGSYHFALCSLPDVE